MSFPPPAPSLPRSVRGVLHRYLPVWFATALLIPHALAFSFLNDDAFISFRYARNLALHGELVFNLGERVEGYTNFLWTVLLAGGIKLGLMPEVSARFFGVFFAVAGLAMVNRIALRLDDDRPRWAHAIAPALLAGTSAYACWTTGGLETQLYTCLFLAALDRTLAEVRTGRGSTSGLFFGLLALTRPEGTLLFFLIAGLRAVHALRGERCLQPRRHEWWAVVLFAALFVPYLAWRVSYYGWLFPNTFYVKSSGGGAGWAMGFYYLRRFVEDHAIAFIAPFILLGWPAPADRARRFFFVCAVTVVAAYLAYAVKVGGDFMGLYRFVLPVFPLLALLIQESARSWWGRLVPLVPRPVLALAAALLLGSFALGSWHTSHTAITAIGADRGIDSPGYLKHYADQRVPIGRYFARHARPDDLMTVGGAGVIAYYSGIRAYDVFGLVDATIAHDASMTVSSRPGHQKWGPDSYMVSRHPTLITHHYSINAPIAPDPEYWRGLGYEWVTAQIPGLEPPSTYSFLKRIDRAFGPFPAR